MTPIEIIILGLSLAFCWSVINPWYNTKPFNCLMCMSGWFSATLAIFSFGWYFPLFFAIGCFVGGLFEAIRNRYL